MIALACSKPKELADNHHPYAEKIIMVMDNLNTHSIASLYQAFSPTEARRLAERLDIHYTPKHASWLNMAEIGIGKCAIREIDLPRDIICCLSHKVNNLILYFRIKLGITSKRAIFTPPIKRLDIARNFSWSMIGNRIAQGGQESI